MNSEQVDLYIRHAAGERPIARLFAELAATAGLAVRLDDPPGPGGQGSPADQAAMTIIIVGGSRGGALGGDIGDLAARARAGGPLKLTVLALPDADDIPSPLADLPLIDLRTGPDGGAGLATATQKLLLAATALAGGGRDGRLAVANLLAAIGKRLYVHGRHREAIDLFDRAMDQAAAAIATADDPTGLLAGWVRQVVKAVTAAKRPAMDEAAAPMEQLIALLGNWAGQMHADGDHGGARHVIERLMEILGKVSDNRENPAMLTLANNLALNLMSQGYLAEAGKRARNVLVRRRRLLGDKHPDTLAAAVNLAAVHQAGGNLGEALKLLESVLAERHRQLGDEHPDTLAAMNNLASACHALGDLAGARSLLEAVLDNRRRRLGGSHPDTLAAMSHLAATLGAQGDLDTARALLEAAVAACRHLLGDEHPDTLAALANLAGTLHAQGDLDGARTIEEAVLAARRRRCGEEHPATLAAMNNLATTLGDQGNLSGARAQLEWVLAVRLRTSGDRHPDTLTAMANLAAVLKAQGDPGRARALEESTLAGRRGILGDDHPDTVIAAWNLLHTRLAMADYAATAPLLQTHLLPLLRRNADALPAALRRIREQLAALAALSPHQA